MSSMPLLTGTRPLPCGIAAQDKPHHTRRTVPENSGKLVAAKLGVWLINQPHHDTPCCQEGLCNHPSNKTLSPAPCLPQANLDPVLCSMLKEVFDPSAMLLPAAWHHALHA